MANDKRKQYKKVITSDSTYFYHIDKNTFTFLYVTNIMYCIFSNLPVLLKQENDLDI